MNSCTVRVHSSKSAAFSHNIDLKLWKITGLLTTG